MSNMTKQNRKCELENRIFQYKLKEIRAYKTTSFIVEVKGKTVCLNRNNTLVLQNAPFPTEFNPVELHNLKKTIAGADPIVYSVRDWYQNKLQQLRSLILNMEGI